ncbi:MAG: HlyD family secretion protein [Gemmataceae bacterium]
MTLRKRVTLITGLVLAIGAGLGFFWVHEHHGQPLRLPGTVETQDVRLSSRVGGRVANIAVREGEMVEAGQPLVALAVPELQAQREQVSSRLAAALAQLDKARNGARSEEKAASASAVQALEARCRRLKAGSRSQVIEQARSEVAVVDADLARAKQDFERERALFARTATSRAQYEAAEANLHRLQGQREAAAARLDLALAGSRPEEIAEVEAELARARALHELLLAGTRSEELAELEARVAELRGKLRELDANLAELTVHAPETVLVEVLAVRPGDVVAPNQPVARVLRADDLWIKAYISEVDLGKIRLGQPVNVTIDSYPGRKFDGEISWIASVSEFTPRNVQSVDERRNQVFAIKVRVADTQGIFKSGMAADVFILPQ